MSSLEFINDRIRNYETMLLTAIDTKCSKKQIKHYEERLNVFKQIKLKLEAWEIVKNKNVDMLLFILYYDNLEEYNNYIKSLEEECDYKNYLLTQEEADTIKKALEVENETK